MWNRGDLDDGYDSNKTGSSRGGSPGWVPSHESSWHSKQPGPGNSIFGRRHSAVSDSGDTGIGTYCSDSVEDDSCSSTTPSSLRLLSRRHSSQEDGFGSGVPVVHVKPSASTSSCGSLRTTSSPTCTGRWANSCPLSPPTTSPLAAQTGVDMQDKQPIRRWSSLTKLSSGVEKNSRKASVQHHSPGSHGSLDRGLLSGFRKEPRALNRDLYLPLSSSLLSHSLLQRSPGAGPCYWSKPSSKSGLETDLSLSSTLSSPIKHSGLGTSCSSLTEAKLPLGGGQVYGLSLSKLADSPLGHPVDRDSPIQPAVRTQMWLTEQMEYSSKAEHAGELGQGGGGEAKVCGGEGASLEQGINQMLQGTSHFVNTLVKVKEGMLRQKELEIDRQKQQILQLHARIRENELRAQQVLHSQRWFEDPQILTMKKSVKEGPSDRLRCDEDLSRKLAVSELEVLHLNELYKQATHKYTEDLRKLEEKIKTRDRYISSLKKKYQRESDQNHEKQQRIETLEKYLADLPTLGEVQVQALQLETVQLRARDLERTVSRLQKKLDDSCALLKEKDGTIETQARREDELIATVHRLQQKVQRCLEDGVRLDLKHLQVENSQLLERQDRSGKLIEHQKEQIERLNSQLKVTSTRRQKGRNLAQHLSPPDNQELRSSDSTTLSQVDDWLRERAGSNSEPPQAGRLLKELSLCLLDLQALRSILVQRAQGKELNLSLLLGMTSLNASAEESERRDEQEEVVLLKPLEVGQLRRGVDELRKNVAEWYGHFRA
ncbi:centrosomal protein of 85 kDa-like [Hippocampus comes]|uniref:Centrosomal protein 85, like n=1 Tax=Hippocampus comes TaxID=109280 RepID=A0A3Q2XLV4_HIPCM|nr:PREDICTED: centrosomal protein of 85 kDa-like [Hippocampus comes]